jgi:uncharacterized iron-regulated membrane protein
MGPAVPTGLMFLGWFLDLHDNLLGGETGRYVNGVGGLLLTILALTGVVVWWSGIKNWLRSVTIHRGVNWNRFNRDLHSALGFWTSIFVLMWAFTGFFLVYQQSFSSITDFLATYNAHSVETLLVWLPRLHFGRFRGLGPGLTLTYKIVWVIFGLAPAVLSTTGVLMWWNRVVRKGHWREVLQVQRTEKQECKVPESVRR